MTKVILVTEMVLKGLETPTSFKVVILLRYEHNISWTGAHRFDSGGMVFLMRVVYEFVLSRCRPKTVLFRGLPRCFASLVSRGFLRLRWAEKLNLFLSSSVFMGSFNSYELFIIPWLDSVIHNSGFSNSKYSLFIFVYSLFIIQLPHPNALKFFSVESLRVKL